MLHVKNRYKNKVKERGIKGFLVGYTDNAYRVIEPETGKIYRSKDVDFIESKTYGYEFNEKEKKTILTDPVLTEEGREWWYKTHEKEEAAFVYDIEKGHMCEVRNSFSLMCKAQMRDGNADEEEKDDMYALQVVDKIERETKDI